MKKKINPPSDPVKRKAWDATRHWEKTFGSRERTHSIIPEYIKHWRIELLKTFQTEGQTSAERTYNQFVQHFREAAKDKSMTKEEANGAIENLTSLMEAMKNLRDKKRKLKTNRN